VAHLICKATQAKQREVVVVTGDKLVNIAELLKKQAINPDFMRM
jgi:hypothetical protein